MFVKPPLLCDGQVDLLQALSFVLALRPDRELLRRELPADSRPQHFPPIQCGHRFRFILREKLPSDCCLEHVVRRQHAKWQHYELCCGNDTFLSRTLPKDRYGRRVTYLVSSGIYTLAQLGLFFSFDIYMYIAMNFLGGFGALEIYVLNFVILNESSSSMFRQKASIGTLIG